jgi:hypothetical protein
MKYTATFQPRPGVSPQKVHVEAMNADRARDALEAQYGRGTITNVQIGVNR